MRIHPFVASLLVTLMVFIGLHISGFCTIEMLLAVYGP